MKTKIHISQPVTGEEELNAMRRPLESGWLTQGPCVADFEREFAVRHQSSTALATTSCTTALHLILCALGIGPGDEVIVPAFTWVATANAVLYCGATPVLCDVDPKTFNIDPVAAAIVLTERTKAAIPVHLFGLCADMEALAKALPGIALVCDAACAVGASYHGVPAGALGVASAFSFHPRKPITTGEGGMITTNDDQLGEAMVMYRNHGASVSEEVRHHGPSPYLLPDFNVLGFNYRMTDLQGAVGLVQLSRLDGFMKERRQMAAFYSRELEGLDWLSIPCEPEGYGHGWQSYVLMVDEAKAPVSRNALMQQLESEGIATRPGTHALHTLGHLRKKYGLEPEDFPGAALCERASLAIPLHNAMGQEDLERVVEALKKG